MYPVGIVRSKAGVWGGGGWKKVFVLRNYACEFTRNSAIMAPSAEASSVLSAPGRGTEGGAAGRVAAAQVGGWGHHAAVTPLPGNFTLGIGH